MTWPSFFAASIRSGVTGSGGGASARTRVENAAPASTAPDPLSRSRRDNPLVFIIPVSVCSVAIGTPEVIFYSGRLHRVFRRQRVAVAARLDKPHQPATCAAEQGSRIRETEMTGPRLTLALRLTLASRLALASRPVSYTHLTLPTIYSV